MKKELKQKKMIIQEIGHKNNKRFKKKLKREKIQGDESSKTLISKNPKGMTFKNKRIH